MRTTTVIIVAALGIFIGSEVLATEMPVLARKYECDGCHGIDSKTVGPAWMAVSAKYKGVAKYTYAGREYPLEEGLVMKVSRGGSGIWGAMPMPPNDPKGQNQTDMRTLVRFILRLAN